MGGRRGRIEKAEEKITNEHQGGRISPIAANKIMKFAGKQRNGALKDPDLDRTKGPNPARDALRNFKGFFSCQT